MNAKLSTRRAPRNRWAREQRTGEQYLRDLAQMTGGVAALERACQVCKNQISNILEDPGRSCTLATLEKLRAGTGLPITAILYRGRPIREVMADELSAQAGAGGGT